MMKEIRANCRCWPIAQAPTKISPPQLGRGSRGRQPAAGVVVVRTELRHPGRLVGLHPLLVQEGRFSEVVQGLTPERHPPQAKACLPLQRGNSERPSISGFTLLELLVVLLLIGLLTALVFPSIGRGMGALKLKTSSREIMATLRLARSKAITEQKIYWVSFDLEKNEIELSSDDRRYQKSFQLPEGITIAKVASVGVDEPKNQQSYHYFFEPNGMAQAFEVLLQNRGGRGTKIFQDPLMRSPRFEEVASESSGITVVR
jgi:general secretion pathway protein H